MYPRHKFIFVFLLCVILVLALRELPDFPIPNWLVPAGAWAAIGLSIAMLVAFLRAEHNHAVRETRVERGRCPSCGYDLRATPGACPECGYESSSGS
jgi:hypothetical protein